MMLKTTSEQLDERFLAHARKFSYAASLFAMLVGGTALAGWLLRIDAFKSVYGDIMMKPNAALSLFFAGASLLLLNYERENRVLRSVGRVSAAMIAVIGLLTLTEHAFGWDLGIDQLLFTEPVGALATTSPGHMGLPASISFTLSGVSLFLLHGRRALRLPQVLAIIAGLIASLAIIGYAYQAEQLYAIARNTGIALPTAMGIFVLGLGILASRIDQGITAAIAVAGHGAIMARRLLFVALTVPFVLGWFRLSGQRHGYYDLGFGTAIEVLSTIVIFSIAIWRGAVRFRDTEQLKDAAKLDLREKEQTLTQQATLLDLSYEPIFIWELQGGIVEWNKGSEQVYGYTRKEAMGEVSHRLLKTEFPTSAEDVLQTLKLEGHWSGDLRHTTANGRLVVVESRQQLIESNGKFLVLETNRDITDRKNAEETSLHLAAIVTSSTDAILSKTLDGVITSWNNGAAQMFGYTAEEMIGTPIIRLIPEDRRHEEDEILKRLKAGDRIEHYETVRVTKEGRNLDVSLTISPIRDSKGKILGASKIIHDITERKRSAYALQKSEKLQRLLAHIGELSVRMPGTGEMIEAIGERVSSEFGVSRCGFARVNMHKQEIFVEHDYHGDWPSLRGAYLLADYGRHFADDARSGRITAVEDLAAHAATASRYESVYKPIGIRSHVNVPLHRNGRWLANFWITHHEPRSWSSFEIALMRIIADRIWLVLERKKAEEDRDQLLAREQAAREQAETASRLKDEFLATVSHELRTPLNAILGWTAMLRNGTVRETDSVRALETIERNARAQAQLIEDILDVSRTISGKLRLNIKPTEIITVIRAAIDSVRPAAQAKDIHLELLLDTCADHIQADEARLQQVVWNLLANAIKFTPKGGRVQVKLERLEGKAQLTVSDTGEGIPSEFLPYVFNRFQQADGTITRRHGGLGLGLAIARHLVEMHGGTIEAMSEGVGKGASFIVRMPISRSQTNGSRADKAVDQLASRNVRPEEVPDLSALRILAIDDEKDARDMLRTLLEACGADVLTAASAKEGLAALAGWKPHVLICDIGMPEEDGYSLIRKVRALGSDRGGSTPAIALTGYVRVEERMRALEAGYQMFLPKPVETDELQLVIAGLVERKARIPAI